MSELVNGTIATEAGAFHAGQQVNIDLTMPAIPPSPGPHVPSPSHPMPQMLPHSHPEAELHLHACQALQEKMNVPKDDLYNDELSCECSDSEQILVPSTSILISSCRYLQVPSKPTSHKHKWASTESLELSSSGHKPTHRGKWNAEVTINVADAIWDLSRSMVPLENFVAKVLKLIHDDGDFPTWMMKQVYSLSLLSNPKLQWPFYNLKSKWSALLWSGGCFRRRFCDLSFIDVLFTACIFPPAVVLLSHCCYICLTLNHELWIVSLVFKYHTVWMDSCSYFQSDPLLSSVSSRIYAW